MIQIKGNWLTREVTLTDLVTGRIEILDPKPSQKIINHSPDGFAWGYGGSGPSQLALALLLRFTQDKATALQYYQFFKWNVIAELPDDDFTLSDETIYEWLKAHEMKK